MTLFCSTQKQCRRCYSGLKRAESSNGMSEETRQNVVEDINSSQHIWTVFDGNIGAFDCVSCAHFLKLGKGGRPAVTIGERGPAVTIGERGRRTFEAVSQSEHTSECSTSAPFNVDPDSDNDNDSHVFKPPVHQSTPRKTPQKMDSQTPPIRGVWTPSPKRKASRNDRQDMAISPTDPTDSTA